MKKLAYLIASLSLALGVFSLVRPVLAVDPTPQDSVCSGIGIAGDGGDCTDTTGSPTVQSVVRAGISLLSYLVGIAAIILIIVGGFKYITSGGDSNKVGSAKSTILYALIGLVIAVLAQVLVRFVLAKAAPSSANAVNTTIQ